MLENKESAVEKSVSVGVFWKVLKKYWILLTVAALVVGAGVGVACHLLYRPVWSSSAQFYVSNVAATTYLYSSGQTTGAKEMVENCEDFVRGTVVLDRVLGEIDRSQTAENRKALDSMIRVKKDEKKATFAVVVSSADKELALQVCHAIEKILPTACDEFNNQHAEIPSNSTEVRPILPEGESLLLKVISSGEEDQSADNFSSLIKRPILAAMAAFIFLYGILLIVQFTDMTIYTKDDLREKLPQSISVFGVIPHWSAVHGKKQGGKHHKLSKKQRLRRRYVEELVISRPNVPFDVEEAFHQLCTNVTFCSTGEKGCSVGVLSTYSASGKSFVMANLAVSLSRQIDKKILLVDADMRCPMVHKIFQLPNKNGLSNLLAGQTTAEQAMVNQNGLDILTAGTLPPNPMELLSGPNMEKLMEKWRTEYDYILIDLPPVGEVSDAVAISKLLSGYLFVVRSGISDARAISECCDTMQKRDAKIFGYVLTDVVPEHMGKYASYHKYFYYRYSDQYRRRAESANTTEAAPTLDQTNE